MKRKFVSALAVTFIGFYLVNSVSMATAKTTIKASKYTPDFLIIINGLLVETKGRFTSQERKKFKLLKEQHPEIDLRFVFSNPNTRIGKKSKTTYGMWCERIGYPYAKELIPTKWLKENGKKKD